jgi:hypothetical protein
MTLHLCSIQEAWGTQFNDNDNNNNNNNNENKNKNKNTKHLEVETVDGFEGFSNFSDINNNQNQKKNQNKKKKKKKKNEVNIVQEEVFDSDSDEEPSMISPIINTKTENDELRSKMNELDTKLNLLLNKMTETSEEKEKEKSEEKTDGSNNAYDIVLFVVFGLFILLMMESISKLIIRNAQKTNVSGV